MWGMPSQTDMTDLCTIDDKVLTIDSEWKPLLRLRRNDLTDSGGWK